MIKKVLKATSKATRRLWRNRRVAFLLLALYSSLLGVLYLFISTREASVLQVLLTLIFAALAPALFFILQAVVVGHAQGEVKALVLLRRSLRDSCKLALISMPLILVAAISVYLLNRFQLRPSLLFNLITPAWPTIAAGRLLVPSSRMWQWWPVLMATLRFMIFAILLPLSAIHLWSATLRDGLLPTLKRVHHTLAVAFTPSSLLTYTLGLTLFAIIPYFLLFGHTHAAKAWVELALLLARLLLIFLLTIYGWTITVYALNKRMKDERRN
jgi:hypothetical protein